MAQKICRVVLSRFVIDVREHLVGTESIHSAVRPPHWITLKKLTHRDMLEILLHIATYMLIEAKNVVNL